MVARFAEIKLVGKTWFGNPSVNMTTIAIFSPLIHHFANRRFKIFVHILLLGALYQSQSWMGVWTYLFGMSIFGLLTFREPITRKIKEWESNHIKKVFAGIVCVLLFYAYQSAPYLLAVHGSGRLQVWHGFLKYWADHFNVWIGSGNGTWAVWGPIAQQKLFLGPTYYDGPINGSRITHLYLTAHSDWLQLLFETGLTGFTLGVIFFGWLLFRSFKKPWLCAAIAAYGVAMLGNMPLTLPFTAVVASVFVVAVRQLEQEQLQHNVF